MREEISNKKIQKITRHQFLFRVCSFIEWRIIVLNFSLIETSLFVASLMDPCTVSDPYAKGFMRHIKPRVAKSTRPLSRLDCFMHATFAGFVFVVC